ncbi:Poly [ADP-ribose] polymerase 1-like protein, partial [Dinothrombium tinctorium]
MKRTDIVRLLEYNNQHVPESNSSKYERLADCMVFGALEKCPECKNGQLVFRIAGYICTGHISEWTTCLYQTQTPARKSFKIPEDIRDSYDFLSTYEFKEHKRVYNKVEAPTSAVNHIERAMQPSTSSTSAIENGTDVAKLPLKGHKVAYVGKMKLSKRALKEKILSLGGKLVDEIDRTVLFIISTQKEVEKEGAKIAKAKTCGVTVVSEDVFDALNEKVDICDLIKRNTISPWGGDVSKKHKTLVDKDKLKSGSGEPILCTDTGLTFSFLGMKSRSGSSKSEPKIQSFKMKAGLVVDPDSGLDHVAHVYKDQNGPYSVVLAKVDIVSNKNSYYKIQLLESDEAKKKHQYWVYRAWGRIGTDIGGDKLEKFKLKSNAIDNFCEVFLEHTGNEWKKKKEFKKLPGRYHIVETHYGNSLDDDKKLVVGNSCLPLPVQDLITMIFDISRMKHQMQEFHLDLAKMPLGKISKDQVMSAYAVLNEISCMIETNEKSLTKMLDASNRFYSLIPHDFGTDNVIVIKNKELLQEKLEMLDSLLEMELAFELVSDIKEEGEDVLKQHYDRLDANIEVLDKNSEEF